MSIKSTQHIDETNLYQGDEIMKYAHVLNQMNAATHHMIINGAAGSGKTTLIRQFIQNTNHKIIVTATTGIAAEHIGGITLHSALQLNPNTLQPKSKIPKYKIDALQSAEIMIVDEISMLSCEMVSAMDMYLRNVRGNNVPFGDLKMIFVGDMFQLGPVPTNPQVNRKQFPYYFFSPVIQSQAFLNTTLFFELRGSFRQHRDSRLKTILDSTRIGQISTKYLRELNNYCVDTNVQGPVLCMRNEAVANWNAVCLRRTDQPLHRIFPQVTPVSLCDDIDVRNHRANKPIDIKLGAQIIFTINDPHMPGRFQNGTRGYISGITVDPASSEVECVNVTLPNYSVIQVTRMQFPVFKLGYNYKQNCPESKHSGSISNFPFQLGYASTVHKSQGLTLEYGWIELDRGAFQPGQMYTALSRFSDISNIRLSALLSHDDFMTDPAVCEYMNRMRFQAVHP